MQKPSTNPFLNVSPVHVTPKITNPFHVSLSQPLIDLETIATTASLNNNYKNDQNGNETTVIETTKSTVDNGNAPISLPTNPFNVTIDTVDNDNNENQINEKNHINYKDTINNHRNVNDNIVERRALEEKCKNKRNTQVSQVKCTNKRINSNFLLQAKAAASTFFGYLIVC